MEIVGDKIPDLEWYLSWHHDGCRQTLPAIAGHTRFLLLDKYRRDVALLKNVNRGRESVVIQYRLHYLHHVREKSISIRLFSVSVLLELNLTRLLDEVANMAAACGKEISATVAGDVIAATSVASLNGLRNTLVL